MGNIGTEIKTRRTALGITQTELAEAAGVSFSLVSKLEQGVLTNPTLGTWGAIMGALSKFESAAAVADPPAAAEQAG